MRIIVPNSTQLYMAYFYGSIYSNFNPPATNAAEMLPQTKCDKMLASLHLL
jgi:hypothetical protein